MTKSSSPAPESDSELAHDLRAAVGVARGYVRFLLSGAAGPVTAPQRDALGAIERQTVRLTELVEKLDGLVCTAPQMAPTPSPEVPNRVPSMEPVRSTEALSPGRERRPRI